MRVVLALAVQDEDGSFFLRPALMAFFRHLYDV
jgi:hypothetical protein